MLEAAEAVTAALDLLDAEVEAFGGPVRRSGGVVGEDLRPPPLQCLAEADDLRHVIREAAGDRLVEHGAGVGPRLGQVDVADVLLGEPGAEHLVVRVTDAQAK